MNDPHVVLHKVGRRWHGLAGLRIRRFLSAELFLEVSSPAHSARTSQTMADRCRDRWIDLAGALAAMPDSPSIHLVLACRPEHDGSGPQFDAGFLTIGSGTSRDAARGDCLQSLRNLSSLVPAILDYAEFEPLVDEASAARLVGYLKAKHVLEFRRRIDRVRLGREPDSGRVVFGFSSQAASERKTRRDPKALEIPHLFPWSPSDDPWWRLTDVMSHETTPTAVVVHARGWGRAPAACREAAERALAGAAGMMQAVDDADDPLGVLALKAAALRQEVLHRHAILEGPVLAARVFLVAEDEPSAAIRSALGSSLDDASVGMDQPEARLLFRGGADVERPRPAAVLTPLDDPSIDQVFSPREASAVLRTPMPTDVEVPGFVINRSRTAAHLGPNGDDAPLGRNVHRGLSRTVRVPRENRPRHCYVIGQTGTGKSTFLLQQILHDVECGRGVAVIDPHGSLVEDVLRRFPEERADDLIILDLTDRDHPVGFNPLILDAVDSNEYRNRRDLLIDELFSYIDKTYDLAKTGGPIFETHFRGMLALLLGIEVPPPTLVPNLLVFRQTYTNAGLRHQLRRRIDGKDVQVEEFLREALGVTGEARITELAPYITSKFIRFISDANLRNITCQSRTVDFDAIVNGNKVLLMNLGKGHIGEYAAGLLASQVVARVQGAVMRRGRPRSDALFCLYADEFHMVATPRFAELLAEGRKFGLSVTMAHQYAAQVPMAVLRSILGNVGTTVLFRVGAQDAEIFGPQFAPFFGSRDLTSLANFRAYVRSMDRTGPQTFNVDVDVPSPAGPESRARKLRAASRRKHARPRAAVEREIQATIDDFAAFRCEEGEG